MLLAAWSAQSWADGTEALGPPIGLTIQPGSGLVAAGVGLSQAQPGTLNVNVPAAATVKQVLLYWEGQSLAPAPGDDTIVVNGNSVTGSLIGGPTFFFSNLFGNVQSSSFRADITALGLVAPGANALSVGGLSYGYSNDGAGVVVIFDDGSGLADIDIRDGNDLAFFDFAPPLDTTVPQTFTFAAAPFDRTINLAVFFGDVEGVISGFGSLRPTAIEITVDAVTTTVVNALGSVDGQEWDTLNIPVFVPAGATFLTVQAFSRDDAATGELPASFAWIGAFLSIEPFCGDGSVNQPAETCDPPGSAIPGNPNTCSASCTYCGDGNIDSGEECEPSLDPMCSQDCRLLTCEDLLDHFKCYGERDLAAPGFQSRNVTLVDQFGSSQATALRPYQLCNPVDKNAEGVVDPTAHLNCYRISDSQSAAPNVTVHNQFGDQTYRLGKADRLCVPAEKNGVASALNLDHFKCYRARSLPGAPRFQKLEVTLADQFETKHTIVVKPALVCNPVDKNGEGIRFPACHLTCYRIKDAPGETPFLPREASVVDQFGGDSYSIFPGSCHQGPLLCVPSLKELAP